MNRLTFIDSTIQYDNGVTPHSYHTVRPTGYDTVRPDDVASSAAKEEGYA